MSKMNLEVALAECLLKHWVLEESEILANFPLGEEGKVRKTLRAWVHAGFISVIDNGKWIYFQVSSKKDLRDIVECSYDF